MDVLVVLVILVLLCEGIIKRYPVPDLEDEEGVKEYQAKGCAHTIGPIFLYFFVFAVGFFFLLTLLGGG